MFITFAPHDFHRIGSVDVNGWNVTAWRRNGAYSITATRGSISLDTLSRESIGEAWRVLRSRLDG